MQQILERLYKAEIEDGQASTSDSGDEEKGDDDEAIARGDVLSKETTRKLLARVRGRTRKGEEC